MIVYDHLQLSSTYIYVLGGLLLLFQVRRKTARQADQIGASHILYNIIVVVCNVYRIVICDEREDSSMLVMPITVIYIITYTLSTTTNT